MLNSKITKSISSQSSHNKRLVAKNIREYVNHNRIDTYQRRTKKVTKKDFETRLDITQGDPFICSDFHMNALKAANTGNQKPIDFKEKVNINFNLSLCAIGLMCIALPNNDKTKEEKSDTQK